MTTPNMNLPVPTVASTAGPDWANDINACLDLIDAHDHTPGYGVPITPDGISITSALNFADYDLYNVRSVRFLNQTSAFSSATDIGCVYELNGDLYYRDASTNNIQMTKNGGVNAGSGSIANLTSPASASYVSANQTFVWQSNTNTPANLDLASLILRNLSSGSFGVTVSPPASLGNNFDLTLPTPPVSGSRFVSIDNSGTFGAVWNVDDVTLEISSNVLQVPSNVNLPGKAVQENGNNVVVSNTNTTNSLSVIRGTIGNDGEIFTGEGFTVTKISMGKTQINFTTAFADEPSIVATPFGSAAFASYVSGFVSSSLAQIQMSNAAGVPVDYTYKFIAIGQRA